MTTAADRIYGDDPTAYRLVGDAPSRADIQTLLLQGTSAEPITTSREDDMTTAYLLTANQAKVIELADSKKTKSGQTLEKDGLTYDPKTKSFHPTTDAEKNEGKGGKDFNSKHPRATAGTSGGTGGEFVPLGQGRNDAAKADQKAAAGDKGLQQAYRDAQAGKADLGKMSPDQLGKLSKLLFSYKTSNPGVVKARLAAVAELRKRGMDPAKYGSLSGGKAPAGKATAKAAGKVAAKTGKAAAKVAPSGGVDVNKISNAKRDQLIAAGWRGDPNDGKERLYPPKNAQLSVEPLREAIELGSWSRHPHPGQRYRHGWIPVRGGAPRPGGGHGGGHGGSHTPSAPHTPSGGAAKADKVRQQLARTQDPKKRSLLRALLRALVNVVPGVNLTAEEQREPIELAFRFRHGWVRIEGANSGSPKKVDTMALPDTSFAGGLGGGANVQRPPAHHLDGILAKVKKHYADQRGASPTTELGNAHNHAVWARGAANTAKRAAAADPSNGPLQQKAARLERIAKEKEAAVKTLAKTGAVSPPPAVGAPTRKVPTRRIG